MMLAAMWLLLAVWPPTAQLACTKGHADQCKAAKEAPGTNLAGEGFDVVTMERKQAYVIDMDTWQQQNGSCTLCTNPFMGPKPQRLPVAVVDWRAVHKCNMQLTSKVYDSSEAFIKESHTEVEASWKVNLNIATPKAKASLTVGGSHSRAAQNVMAMSKKDKYSFIKQEVDCSYYSYRLRSDPPLHPEFIQAVNALSPIYTDQTRVVYRNLLTTFGTHYIHKARLGGRVKSVTSVRVCQASLEGYTETQVKDCLDVEVTAGTHTNTVDSKAEAHYCKKELEKRRDKQSFSNMFRERLTQVVGGRTEGTADLLFSAKIDPTAIQEWKKTLITTPDINNYALQPLHMLVKHPEKRQGLKKAIEDYILEQALIQRCSSKCPGGSTRSTHDVCNCVCQSSAQMTSQCCPQQRGLARLKVTVRHATGLWGDTTSKTDGFVKVLFKDQAHQTRVIYDNDNPTWNREFDMGFITLSQGSTLTLEVFDEDKQLWKWWNDDLGKCNKPITSGKHDKEMCPLNHGTLFFSYEVSCAPGLTGTTCTTYAPSVMSPDLRDLYVSRDSLNVTQELLAHLRMGHRVEDPLTFVLKHEKERSKQERGKVKGNA